MKDTVSRRSVLLGAGATAVGIQLFGVACGRPGQAKRKGTILGPGRFVDTRTGSMSYVLCLFDLDRGDSRTIDMTYFGHGLALRHTDNDSAAAADRLGMSASALKRRIKTLGLGD